MLFVVVFTIGQFVTPDLAYPKQVGGMAASFYVHHQGQLLTQAILFGASIEAQALVLDIDGVSSTP